MYDIKSIESGEKDQNIITRGAYFITTNENENTNKIGGNSFNNKSSSNFFAGANTTNLVKSLSISATDCTGANSMIMSLRRRRVFQRQACLLSVMIAFSLGLALGVFLPMIGMSTAISAEVFGESNRINDSAQEDGSIRRNSVTNSISQKFPRLPDYRQPEVGGSEAEKDSFSVSFVRDEKLPAEEVFRNAFHLAQDKVHEDTMIVKKLDASDGSIKEFKVQRTADGLFRKGPEVRLSKPSVAEQMLKSSGRTRPNRTFAELPINTNQVAGHEKRTVFSRGVIDSDIYWGERVEQALPRGFGTTAADDWNAYVKSSVVTHLETGCGRMQNRMVVFSDGRRACARYRQNTDQIQGELFSFYLGQLLNLTNLAPSAASVIDLESETWSLATQDITNAQWKSARPVVLTKWLPDLEPAGIPLPFQPLERHLNKFDIWNITLGLDGPRPQKGLLDRLGAVDQSKRSADGSLGQPMQSVSVLDAVATGFAAAAAGPSTMTSTTSATHHNDSNGRKSGNGHKNGNNAFASDVDESTDGVGNVDQRDIVNDNENGNGRGSSASNSNSDNNSNGIDIDRSINPAILNRLIELAQWSDLIVFDYLIANLDRVVNNLYNYQWNADIMAAPAHNLARQTDSQLLVFLDNESGLLHGYRLLKKYEAYHGLLLDNLCVFRRPTIVALQSLREYGAGHQLQQLFESSTNAQVRDVLPSLPDKSIKILVDRIDRVLGQVQKCRDLFADR